MSSAARQTLISILMLLALGLLAMAEWFSWGATRWSAAGWSLLFCLVLGLATWQWLTGLNKAGRGVRRALYLLAFAAPIVWIGLWVTGGAHDAYEGFQAGYREGANMATQERLERGEAPKAPMPPPPNPFPVMPPGIQLASWILFTLILAKLLDLMEQRGAEADRQRELAKEARSEALRGKLAPHFIFNALNTLHAQIEADPKGAEATTEKLAALFRQVLEVSDKATIPLRQELNFIEAYLGIEQARLGNRLRVSVEIPEELESSEIPPLSLQVLVENAIKHGVNPLEPGGEVRIGAQQREAFLHLWVEDPGPGFSVHRGTGTALETLRQRLEKPEDLEMGMVDGRHRVGFRWRQA
jgi:hypothetical protein